MLLICLHPRLHVSTKICVQENLYDEYPKPEIIYSPIDEETIDVSCYISVKHKDEQKMSDARVLM